MSAISGQAIAACVLFEKKNQLYRYNIFGFHTVCTFYEILSIRDSHRFIT